MQKIVVASTNPVKIKASQLGFRNMFPEKEIAIDGVSVPSGVSEQPKTDRETYDGAMQRAKNARGEIPEADLHVGIEGGIEEVEGGMYSFAWVIIQSKDGKTGEGKTGTFLVPPALAERVREGVELGKADDDIFNLKNSKQKQGTVGILTDNAIDRTTYYTEAVTLALIPFKNPELYSS